MRVLLFSFLVGLLSSVVAAAQGDELDGSLQNPGVIEEPEWFKQSFLDIREDIAEASEQNKRVLLYFHQDGCPYCAKLIKENFGDPELSRLTQTLFDTIAINLWGDREVVTLGGDSLTEKEFSKSLKVQFTPTLLMLDESGHVVLRVNGYYPPKKFGLALNYAGRHLEQNGSFRDYQAAATLAERGVSHNDPAYLAAPLQLKDTLQGTRKPLLVIFEQQQCPSCDELHADALRHEDSRKLLTGFNVATVDMWSTDKLQTPDGSRQSAKQWAESLGVEYAPSMVFFDTDGMLVFRTDAYIKAFHAQSAMAYVLEKAYLKEPEFQRFVQRRADDLRAAGLNVDVMK